MRGKFYLSDHQGKGRAYARALVNAGYEQAASGSEDGLGFVLYDHDVGSGGMGFRNGLDYFHARGMKVMLYPHAARPMVQWDGMYPVWPHARVNFTIAAGHREVMESFGYPIPVEVAGWTYCEIKGFAAGKSREGLQKIKVLFGPIHPNNNGWMHPVDKAKNAEILHRLLKTPDIELTVRHIKRIDLSGLWMVDGVKYVMGKANQCIDEIDQADVVVGNQTFAHLAVARGKPLIMFGDDVKPHSGNRPENFRYAKSWEKYRHLLQYPLEIEAAGDGEVVRGMMQRAMMEDVGAEWRERFIGKAFDGARFVEMVERWLE